MSERSHQLRRSRQRAPINVVTRTNRKQLHKQGHLVLGLDPLNLTQRRCLADVDAREQHSGGVVAPPLAYGDRWVSRQALAGSITRGGVVEHVAVRDHGFAVLGRPPLGDLPARVVLAASRVQLLERREGAQLRPGLAPPLGVALDRQAERPGTSSARDADSGYPTGT